MKLRFIIVSLLMLFSSIVLAQSEPEDLDLEQAVATIDGEDVTLGYLRNRLEYERFYYYYVIESIVEQFGEDALNVSDPNNQVGGFIQQLANNLVDDEVFATPIYDTVILERIYTNEAAERGLELDTCDADGFWTRLLNRQQEFVNCELPEGFEEERLAFVEQVREVSSLTQEEINEMVVGRALYTAVQEALRKEVEVPDVEIVLSRHILVEDEATAYDIYERLQNGEDFQELLVEFTIDPGALGNRGELGNVSRGVLPPNLEMAAFEAPLNEFSGPIQSEQGFHIFEVFKKVESPVVTARHILLEQEEDANTAIDLLEQGNDFAELAQLYSIDTGSGIQGGELGEFGLGMMVPEFEEAAFGAEVGEIIGPVQTQFGYHVIEVTDKGSEVTEVNIRHIVVETEEEAQVVLERLNAGEDFNEMALEVSLDETALGHQGDTRRTTSGTAEAGFYSRSELFVSALEEPIFSADAGSILEPIETLRGFYVIEVQNFDTRPPNIEEITLAENEYLSQWENDQLESDRVERTDFWLDYVPNDLKPSDVYESLAPLDSMLEEAAAFQEEIKLQTTIPNILRNLQLPSSTDE